MARVVPRPGFSPGGSLASEKMRGSVQAGQALDQGNADGQSNGDCRRFFSPGSIRPALLSGSDRLKERDRLYQQSQIIGALLVGGWLVHTDQLEIGGVAAFISGIRRLTDPWGDLVNYFRDVNITQVEFRLMRDATNQQTQGQARGKI